MESEHKTIITIVITIVSFLTFWVWYYNKNQTEQYQNLIAAGLQQCTYTVLGGNGFAYTTTWRKECPNTINPISTLENK
jgi:hypothetical protein